LYTARTVCLLHACASGCGRRARVVVCLLVATTGAAASEPPLRDHATGIFIRFADPAEN